MEAAQPEPAELALSAMRATNDYFRTCLSGSERRVGDPALSSPEQGKDATIALLLSLSNSARRENAALLERAAEQEIALFPAHFVGTSGGFVKRDADSFRFEFIV